MSAEAVLDTAYTLLLDRARQSDQMAQMAGHDPVAVADLHRNLAAPQPDTVTDNEGDDNVIVVGDFSLVELADRLGVQ